MTRLDAKIDVLEVPNYGPVDIRLDKKFGIFKADVGGWLTDTTRAGLNKQILAEVAKILVMVWQPVIEVEGLNRKPDMPRRENNNEIEFKLGLERFWIARKGGGRGWVRADWDDQRDDYNGVMGDWRTRRAKDSHYNFDGMTKPIVRKGGYSFDGGQTIHLPYTDATWASLRAIQAKVLQLEAALAKLIGSEQGMGMLASGTGQLQLTAPDVKDES